MDFAIFVKLKAAERDATQAVRFLQNYIKYGREIAGRGVDDLQHLSGRGLLLQRLACLGNQPGVFDRDDSQVGEGRDQLDLPLGECLDPLTGE